MLRELGCGRCSASPLSSGARALAILTRPRHADTPSTSPALSPSLSHGSALPSTARSPAPPSLPSCAAANAHPALTPSVPLWPHPPRQVLIAPTVGTPEVLGQLEAKGVDVENFPGVRGATGGALVASMRLQALSFNCSLVNDAALELDLDRRPMVVRLKGAPPRRRGDRQPTASQQAPVHASALALTPEAVPLRR